MGERRRRRRGRRRREGRVEERKWGGGSIKITGFFFVGIEDVVYCI